MFLLDKINILLLITGIVNLALGLIVFVKGKDKQVTRVYAYIIFTIIGWIMSMLAYRSASDADALFWGIILYDSATLIASTFLYFTYIFPEKDRTNLSFVARIIFGVNILLIILVSVPGLVVERVYNVPGFEKAIIFSHVYILYFFYILIYFFYGYYRLYKKYLIVNKLQKAQILYLVAGYFIAGNLSFTTNLTFPWMGNFSLNWLGQVFTSVIVGFTAYAIILHKLMDIKLVLRKYSVNIAALSTITGVAAVVYWTLQTLLIPQGFFLEIITICIAVGLFGPLRSFFYKFANKYLFSSLYDSREVIRTLSNKLRATLELQTIYESIFQTLESAFHQKKFAILLFDEDRGKYHPVYTNNMTLNSESISANRVCKFVIKYDKPFSLEDEHTRVPSGFQSLRQLGVEVVNPLNLKGKCVALILLGAKESGDRYNEEDFSVLNITGAQAATAIDNARLYEEVKHFNEDLQKKVAYATKKLQAQNGKLKELDHMKTEFISVASHQLRTPLTATKWALEFLLKGEDGKINAKQRESLSEMSIMNVRLITLVNELLNISRIDEGRLKIEPEPINIATAVKNSLAELLPIARKKELLVVEHYDEVPFINLDPNVITKAISNVLSNAIKYNRDGKHLWVKVLKNKDHVSVIIKDEGIGIPQKEQDQLFQRFYRASNAASSNTEGTGLGLYIAKSVLEMSGGSVSFESEEGVGTTFTITLPLKGSKARKGEKSLA